MKFAKLRRSLVQSSRYYRFSKPAWSFAVLLRASLAVKQPKAHRCWFWAASFCLAVHAWGGSMSYQVTQNPGACREVHLDRLTNPPEITLHDEGVNASYCHLEVRAAAETELYLAAACALISHSHETFPLVREKYA
jgi:hypothetical protein